MKISNEARDYIQSNPDIANEIYNSGVQEGQSHLEPSPKTMDCIHTIMENYKVLLEKFDNLKQAVDRNFSSNQEAHDEIKAYQQYTNGRVKSLEIWRSFILGGLSIITLLVLPMIVYIFFQR
jgi:hypothetical protein